MDAKSKSLFLAFGVLIGAGFVFGDAMGAKITSDGDWFTRFDSLIKAKSRKYNVPWRWIKAIAMNESMLGTARSVKYGIENPTDIEKSKSSDGKSWGVMQVTLSTARELVGAPITAAYLNDPENSIELGTRYIRRLMDIFGESDREKIVRAYNGGPGFAKTTLGQTSTPIYYAKFLVNLQTVMKKQPGFEREIG